MFLDYSTRVQDEPFNDFSFPGALSFLPSLRNAVVECILLRLPALLTGQPGQWRGNIVFIMQVDGADARIIRVDGRQQSLFQEEAQRMRWIIPDRAGLHIAGQVALDTDTVFTHVVDQRRILGGMHGVPNAFCTQVPDRLPDEVGPSASPA